MKVYSDEAICTALRKQAKEIADAGHNGWGGLSSCAADHIEEMARNGIETRSAALEEAVKVCDQIEETESNARGFGGSRAGADAARKCATAIRALKERHAA